MEQNSIVGQKNVVIEKDLNRNRAGKIGRELQEQYKSGFNQFAPLKDKNGASAPITAYFELIVNYPELVGNGVDPTMFNLAKEALQAKAEGASESEINSRYAKSILRK